MTEYWDYFDENGDEEVHVVCPNCDADIDSSWDELIPGFQHKCSECGHEWRSLDYSSR